MQQPAKFNKQTTKFSIANLTMMAYFANGASPFGMIVLEHKEAQHHYLRIWFTSLLCTTFHAVHSKEMK
jgi:uncharacterized protein YxeA